MSKSPPAGRAPKASRPLSLYERQVEAIENAAPVSGSACPLCAETSALPVLRVAGIAPPIVTCLGCGTGRYDPLPTQEEVHGFYPESYYGEPSTPAEGSSEGSSGGSSEGRKFSPLVEWAVRTVAARHIRFLSRGLSPGARILDVGCGRGVLFGPLADRGFEVVGVDISEHAARGADPRAEVRIALRLSEAGFDADSFDQIVIWHVLEHMRDPRETIEECRRILRPGGRLIVAVPNFSSLQARWAGPAWFHLDPPRHLFHFPYEALRQLVEGAGLQVVSSHHFSLRQNPFGWIQSALNLWTRQPTDGLYTLLHDRGPGERPPFDRRSRLAMWAFLLCAAPFAVALCILTAWLRTGATVHVVATRSAS